MRFGICTSLENVNRLAEVGYDYIELGVSPGLMPEADETEFQKIRDQVATAPLKPESYSGFIPGDLRVVGDTVDFPRLSRYVETACRRGSEIGGEIIVYGSSGSRSIADGYSRERALSQIAEFLDMAADHAEAHNMIIAIEPICRREGNILRTVADGLAMAKRVNRKGIRALADLYHVWQKKNRCKTLWMPPNGLHMSTLRSLLNVPIRETTILILPIFLTRSEKPVMTVASHVSASLTTLMKMLRRL